MSPDRPSKSGLILLPILAALAMSLGWGIRGDYGHESGAMLPGALLALALTIAAGRTDWLARASTLAMLGALGWAFGGQMSYGIVIGYTGAATFPDVAYGYAALFLIGALWGGVGAGILATGLTWSRERLESFVIPLSVIGCLWLVLDSTTLTGRLEDRWAFHDTDWVAATSALLVGAAFYLHGRRWRQPGRLIMVLAAGWWLGYGLLTLTFGLRMTPPRSDNWAGCLGLFVALSLYLWREGNRAALLLIAYGLLAGGIGFAGGDFVQMLGRAGWGPIGHYSALQQLDYWKWMEQLFGLIMGLGIALGVRQLLRRGLAPIEPEPPGRSLRYFSLIVLLIIMPWKNFATNHRVWIERGQLSEPLLGIGPSGWVLLVAIGLTVMLIVTIHRHIGGRLHWIPADTFGRAQMLLLVLLWLFVVGDFTRVISQLQTRGLLSVHVGFWLTAILITILVTLMPHASVREPGVPRNPDDHGWRAGRALVIGWLFVPILILGLAKLTIATHSEPLPGSHQRFEFIQTPATE
ncbi:MAG: hypothetical protein ACOYLN_05725 [Blastocatellia bacterium]